MCIVFTSKHLLIERNKCGWWEWGEDEGLWLHIFMHHLDFTLRSKQDLDPLCVWSILVQPMYQHKSFIEHGIPRADWCRDQRLSLHETDKGHCYWPLFNHIDSQPTYWWTYAGLSAPKSQRWIDKTPLYPSPNICLNLSTYTSFDPKFKLHLSSHRLLGSDCKQFEIIPFGISNQGLHLQPTGTMAWDHHSKQMTVTFGRSNITTWLRFTKLEHGFTKPKR